MHITIKEYTQKNNLFTNAKALLFSLLITFFTTSIIYSINTYFYQSSKERHSIALAEKAFKQLSKDTDSLSKLKIQVRNTMKSADNTLIEIYKSMSLIETYKKGTMSEYANSNYCNVAFTKKYKFSNKEYLLKYYYKKRIGTRIHIDIVDAISISFKTYYSNPNAWYKYHLYQKSLVFYSYFIVILIGIYLFGFFFKRLTNTNDKMKEELQQLEVNYKVSLANMNNEKLINHDDKIASIKHKCNQEIQKLNEDFKTKNKGTKTVKNTVEVKAYLEKVTTIEGKEHIDEFISAINSVQESLYILSGWVSTNVLTVAMIEMIDDALNRGVNIYIGFGWGTYSSNCNSLNNLKAYEKEGVEKLFLLLNKYKNKDKGQLYLGYFPTHQKILLKDSEYIICGSNNWLSNSQFKNLETSYKVTSNELIKTEKFRIKDLVKRNIINHCN